MPRIGPYEITGELGRGGMGVVYRARRDAADAHDVALKVIGGGPDASPEALARFQREARIATELDHPGIVKVLETGVDAGPNGDTVWFAMELIEGEPLSQQILEREFTWQGAVRLVREIADAVAVAHARGVLHRDLKPGNIMIDRDGVPHVTDFGLAKDTRTGSKYTRSGETLGTPAYMPPEQARGDLAQLCPASDVWALGCVLYEAVAGRTAFDGPTAAAVVGKVLTERPIDLDVLIPALPRGVARLVRACLAPSPDDRPRDAAALRDDCDRLLTGQQPNAGIAAPPRWRAAIFFAGLAVVGIVGVVGVVAAMSGPAEQRAPGPRPDGPAAVGLPPVTAPSEAERIATRAWAARAADYDTALRELERALQMEPDRADWQVQIGLLLWARSRNAEARAMWAHVPGDSEHWASARLYRGLSACFALKDWTFQTSVGVEDLRLAARGTGRYAELAQIALRVIADRDWAGARRALADRPGWIAALLRAHIEAKDPSGDAARATRDWDLAITEGIPFPWLYFYRGVHLERRGDHAGAIAQYDRALELRPDYQFAVSNRGAIRIRQGDYAAGIVDLERGVALDPHDHLAWEWLGIGRLKQQNPAAALTALHEAVRTKPACDVAYLQRAAAWAALEKLPQSEADLSVIIARTPNHLDAIRSRARVRDGLGDWKGQLADLDAALLLDAQDVEMRAARGVVRLERGLGAAAAAEDFEVCVAADPAHAGNRFNLGLAYLFAREAAKALVHLEAAAAIHRAYLESNPAAQNAAHVKRMLADCEQRAAGARRMLESQGR